MALVRFVRVTHRYPGFELPSLADLDLSVEDGEFLSVVGPSGAGKTTMVRLLAGLESPAHGAILVDDVDITRTPPHARPVGTVAKNHPLFPHLTVAENLALPLTTSGETPASVARRLGEVVGELHLEWLLNRYPRQLLPGELPPVYLARALMRPVGVLVLDDPLGALDHDERPQARALLRDLQRRNHVTTICVTSDQTEAMSMSDRVAVLVGGRLHQIGAPLEVYRQPATRAVAEFFGTPPMSTLVADVVGAEARVADLTLPIPGELLGRDLQRVVVGLRPEDVRVLPRGAALAVRFVDLVGRDALVHGWLGSGDTRQEVVLRCPAREAPRIGASMFVDVLEDENVLFFDVASGRRLH